MLNAKSFVTVDFGAGTLKLAEFEMNEAGALVLKQFALKSLGLEGSQEAKREEVVLKALQEVLAERGVKSKEVNVCAPGFHVFSKFVKLPPVDSGKITQMIQYEAQQNVPFPLAEVVWDYQILGTTAGGELEVLLVAIKSDVVEGLFRVTETSGLKLSLCDVSPAALCNAFRFNYGELEDCTMLLDIGAKTSNLLFFEKGKVFSRSINLGANSITQDFANESKLKFDVADKIKIDEGFVSLGGAYEEPENPNQAAISKIARQFMTRLHIQVNQTLQFYRGQQGGSAPQRLFLSGGASIMPYTAQFFAEKLNVPVEYFNPFRSVQIDPSVSLEELSRVAHSLGEVTGLALRNLANCPVELNLMPESTLRWQSFNQKKPYLLATVGSLVIMAFAVGFLFEKLAGVKHEQVEKLKGEIAPLKAREDKFKKAYGNLKAAQQNLQQTTAWVEERYYWADLFRELRGTMIRVEELTKRKLGTDTGVWIESWSSPNLTLSSETGLMGGMPGMTAESEAFARRYGGEGRRPMAEGEGSPPPVPQPTAEGAAGAGGPPGTNQVDTIIVTCRGVNLSAVSPSANTDIAFALESQLKDKDNPLFEPAGTGLTGSLNTDETTGTFVFNMTLKLKRPLKL
ncbi:MAG: type IV pilus assembly protein PilM [Verrucomicrobia bacterium]|nr:MAG: type IV pilus assembly protein PilM [Verrucomicrobiota bacterium]